MHADELALLRTIHADPNNDDPRLVYADWLDEHGQAERAEFIRLGIAIGRSEDATVGDESRRREEAIRRRQVDLLLAGFDPDERKRIHIRFERGFANSLGIRDGVASDWRILRSLPHIRGLWIIDGVITADVVREIAGLECLDELRMYGPPFAADWLHLLDTLPPWTSVRVTGQEPGFDHAWRAFQDRRIAGLSRAPLERLRQTGRLLLDVGDYNFPVPPRRGQPLLGGRVGGAEDFDLALLSHIEELEELDLDLQTATQAGLRHLGRLPNLRSLRIHSRPLNAIAPLAGCTRLERLDISIKDGTLTDADTEGLEHLTTLRELRLGDSSLGEPTLQRLEPLRRLRVLELQIGASGDSLAVLAGLTKLERLTLVGPTRDRDVGHLSELTELTFLALLDSSLTDAALSHLSRLQKLRTLEIRGGEPSVTEAAAQHLADHLPDVTIILDDRVVKTPRPEFVFQRRLVAGFASCLIPVHWTDDRRRRDESWYSFWRDEDGWKHVRERDGDRPAGIQLSVLQNAGGESAAQALFSHVNRDSHDSPRILERDVVTLAGADTASCVFRKGDRQELACEVIDSGRSVSLSGFVAANRFEEFRRLFLFVARSLRLGEAATLGVDETVTVAGTDL